MIKDRVGSLSSAYSRGVQYFKSGFVRSLVHDERNSLHDSFHAKVKGGRYYSVSVVFDGDAELSSYSCDCPAFYQYDGACKHVVATLKAIQFRWYEFFVVQRVNPFTSASSTKAMLNFFSSIDNPDAEIKYTNISQRARIVPCFCFSVISGIKQSWLEFSIGNERLYILKNLRSFAESVLMHHRIEYGKSFTFDPETTIFDDKSQIYLQMIKTAYMDENNLISGSGSSQNNISIFLEDRKLKLSNSNLLKFLEAMGNDAFEMYVNGTKIQHVAIIDGRPSFNLNVSTSKKGLRMALDMEEDLYYGLDVNFNYFYHKNFIYKVDPLFSSYVAPLMKCFNENKKPEILIPDTDIHDFVSNAVPRLEKVARVTLDPSLSKSYYREALEKQVYLDRYGDGISAKVLFKYGDVQTNPAEEQYRMALVKDDRQLLRQASEEGRLLKILGKYGFEMERGCYVQKDEGHSYRFIKDGLEEIRDASEVFYSESFKNMNIRSSSRISAGVRINSGTGLLEMRINYDDMEPKELMELFASFRLKKRYHRLKTGQFISLDSPDFQAAAELMEQLNLTPADVSNKVIELPKYRAMYIDSLAREKSGLHIERSGAFKKMVQDVKEAEDMEFELPDGICGKLRDYQRTGFKWLKTLSQYGFGGILADDMGLGKTLQMITLLKSEKQAVRKPSLVIAPTSLVYNWQEEVRKFAPDLSVAVLSGTQAGRREKFAEIEASDIVVTSYGMVKKDIDLYKEHEFKFCIIDEAQHIKNPNTLNAKAVKQIRARGYFALTGTPVENTLTELWSIFDFIMPGYLLSHNRFISKFEAPIIKHGDKEALMELGRHIRPFILRRMKKEVLRELPEKIESKMTNEMTPEQKKIYNAYLMQSRKEFEEALATDGFDNSRIKILALLTRLRQICCHPSTFIENYRGGSGKIEMLMELLEDAVDGGHRVLIFSQFTSMLHLIRSKLDGTRMGYHYLDGSTSAQERMRLVGTFNGGEKEIFLISLKAGGTGLNLTGADMVVHFDPWWNPAVEDQATDRAYRIGQNKVVQVFKLITKDTIEEKIYELQQKKKELIDMVIRPGENFLTKMTEDEIRKLFLV